MIAGPAGSPLDVLVIGGGQAGLAMGYHLAQSRRAFQIVDAGAEIGQTWRSRWDSLQLFTSGRYDNLPGLSRTSGRNAATTSPTHGGGHHSAPLSTGSSPSSSPPRSSREPDFTTNQTRASRLPMQIPDTGDPS